MSSIYGHMNSTSQEWCPSHKTTIKGIGYNNQHKAKLQPSPERHNSRLYSTKFSYTAISFLLQNYFHTFSV